MKKLTCLLLGSLASVLVIGQATPVTPVETMNAFTGVTSIFAPFELHSPYSGVGPVLIQGAAQVDFTAGERVHLQPGFQAVNFTGNGYFHAQIGAAPDFDVVFIEPNAQSPQVGLNQKLELGMILPAAIAQEINNYLATGVGVNPFDQEQINIEANFSHGSVHYKTYAFFYEEFERDANTLIPETPYNWLPQTTSYNWRIRFAPRDLGEWKLDISIYLQNSTQPINVVSDIVFNCIPSSNPGFLRVGSDNRHLKFSTSGNSFFAIGQNVAWCDAFFRGGTPTTINRPHSTGILDIHNYISSIGDNEGNFVRFLVTPQFGEIEWGEIGNYSSVNSSGIGQTSNTGLAQAWELDQLFELCESKNVYMMLNIPFHGEYTIGSNEPYWGWESNPYHTGISDIVNPKDLYLDENHYVEVYKHFINKYRYYLSRYGYSTSLGVLQLFSEFDNWTEHENMQNDTPLRAAAFAFLLDHTDYIKSIDDGRSHLLSVSFGTEPWIMGLPSDDHIFDSPNIDVTSANSYTNERTAAWYLFSEYNGCFACSGTDERLFDNWDKPGLLTETGLSSPRTATIILNGDPVDVPEADADDVSGCSDITFHNYMWSSAFSGGYGTALNWWNWDSDDYRENNYPAIAHFFSLFDFEESSYSEPGRWDDATFPTSQSSRLETVYLKSVTHDHVIGWAHNMTYWWGNIDENCGDRYNLTMPIMPGDNDDPGITNPISAPVDALGDPFPTRVEGLNFGRYRIQMYNTTGGGGPYLSPRYKWTDLFGRLEVPSPNIGFLYEADYAFSADLDPLLGLRESNEITLDTVFQCADSVVVAEAVFENDSSEMLTYHWYLNSALYYEGAHPTFSFLTAGVHDIVLVIRNSADTVITYSQCIIVEDCNAINSDRLLNPINDDENDIVSLYPNPATTEIVISSGGNIEINAVSVYHTDGRLLMRMEGINSKQYIVDISQMEPGSYMIIVTSNVGLQVKKFIKI